MTTNTETRVHPFESARLGKAPFRFIRYEFFTGSGAFSAYGADGSTLTLFRSDNHTITGCDYCGTAIKHQYFVGSADGRTFKVGSECIRKVDQKMYTTSRTIRANALRAVRNEERQAARRKADEERQAAREAEQTAWIEANPWWPMLIQHERAKVDTIVQSMAASLARYGKLSDAQAKLAKSILDRWLKPAAEVPLCNERTRVRGVVLSVKEKDHPTMLLYNALIEVTAPCGGTYRLWGTRPTIRGARYEEGCNANIVQKGDTVEFDAIITRSDRDRAFGFFNRATKVKIISKFVPPEVV